MKLPIEGGCRCDRVRIRVSKPPMMTMACHCRGCQRMSSSAYSLTAIFASDGFEVTKGDTVIGGLHGDDSAHNFCAHCMTWMFTRIPAMTHIVNVRSTMLDDTSWVAPFAETYTSTRLPFAQTGAKHSFPEFPPMEAYGDLMKEFMSSR